MEPTYYENGYNVVLPDNRAHEKVKANILEWDG